MSIVESELVLLHHPRLAALATSAWPAWLWSSDASRVLWANAVGAALFGAPDTSTLTSRRFDANDPAAAQTLRLVATLPPGGAARLERLRGFGLGFGGVLTCACARIALGDGRTAALIAASEPAGPALPLGERVRRLFGDAEGALAVFLPDGQLLQATAAARARFGATTTLAALGIAALAAKALEAGTAQGTARIGDVAITRLGEDASRVLMLMLTLAAPASEGRSDAGLPSGIEAAPAPATIAPSKTLLADATSVESEAQTTPPPLLEPSPADESTVERRHPLRFVWQMDADGRFVVGSDEFIELVGPRTTAAFGRLWSEIAAELKLDPENQVARAVTTHETWSGIMLSWPVDETSERLPTELSGLPVFDRDRNFRGYRGFGVCRDITRINALTRARHERPIGWVAAANASSEAGGVASPAALGSTPADTETAPPPSPPLDAAAPVERPTLGLAPAAAANVVPFRPRPPSEPQTPSLSAVERKAFRELAQELTARLRGTQESAGADDGVLGHSMAAEAAPAEAAIVHAPSALAPPPTRAATIAEARAIGDSAMAAAPRDAVADTHRVPLFEASLLDRIPIGVMIYRHDALIFANRHFLDWAGYDSAETLQSAGGLNALFVEQGVGAGPQMLAEHAGAKPLSIMTRHGDNLPVDGRLFTISWNGASALALIVMNGAGADRARATEQALAAAENEIRTLKALIEGEAKTREKSEQELRNAKREAQKATAAKTEFLAKISHEIRTPLNAIVGFAEVIMAERFGPIGNERYREYLKDIHAAGTHLVSLLNDLLDLTKVETGRLDLAFVNVTVNDLIQQCVAIMQPPANRARIIIRTALAPGLPNVVADERSLRQIVLNLLANSIRFTGPGGQVIVSTALSDSHEVVLRVRDTGVGMSEKDIEAALEPFRQTAISGSWGSGGTGLGLPLTKALTEANRAHFSIKSAPNAGTLIEVAFPPSRLAAE